MRKRPTILFFVALVAFFGCDSGDDNNPPSYDTWTGGASQIVQPGVSLNLDVGLQLEIEGGSVGGTGDIVSSVSRQVDGITVIQEAEFSSLVSGSRNGQSVNLSVTTGNELFSFNGEFEEDDSIAGTATLTTESDSYNIPFTIRKE